MSDALMLLMACVAGAALGVVFFGGLWWTIRKGLTATQPALWFLGSLLLRMGIVVTGFYFAAGGQWRRLLACLLGFIIARLVVMRRAGAPLDPRASRGEEAGDAP
jgi:F1F0 ATPase subunit 2